MNRQIQTAIIGFGLSGKVFHAPFIHTHPGFHLRKVAERSSKNSIQLYPYIEVISDYHDLLTDSNLELVVIATPNILHYPIARECLLAGKHIIIEKPFVPTSAEADDLIALSEHTGKNIFVFQNRRWDGDFKTLQKVVSQQMLGQLLDFEAHFDRYSPVRNRAAWRDEAIPASGVMYDLGSHLIDQALALFGKPATIYATVHARRENSQVDDNFRLELSYDPLQVILKAGVHVREPGPRYTLHGTLGSFLKYGIDPQEGMLKAGLMPVGNAWGVEDSVNWGTLNTVIGDLHFKGRIETEPGNYLGFYQNVYDVLVNGANQEVTAPEARNVIRVIELAFESNRSKSAIPYTES